MEFVKYIREDGVEMTSLGTVLSLVGKTGSIGLIPKNFNSTKRVVLILKRGDGTSTTVTCSEAVSSGLRDKSITLGHVLNFDVLSTPNGEFISVPSAEGNAVQEYKVDSITAKNFVRAAIAQFEELV